MLFFSQYWGAKDDDGINKSYGVTLSCMMSVGILFGVMATCFPETVMRLYTDKEHIQRIGVEYLLIAGFGFSIAGAVMGICDENDDKPASADACGDGMKRAAEAQAAKKPEEAAAGKGRMYKIRLAVLVVSVICIIAGMVNGNMKDILIKAINICTECIGLG